MEGHPFNAREPLAGDKMAEAMMSDVLGNEWKYGSQQVSAPALSMPEYAAAATPAAVATAAMQTQPGEVNETQMQMFDTLLRLQAMNAQTPQAAVDAYFASAPHEVPAGGSAPAASMPKAALEDLAMRIATQVTQEHGGVDVDVRAAHAGPSPAQAPPPKTRAGSARGGTQGGGRGRGSGRGRLGIGKVSRKVVLGG